MTPIHIKCSSKTERLAALTMILGMGIKWHGADNQKTAQEVENVYPFSVYPTLKVEDYDEKKMQIVGTRKESKDDVSMVEAYEKISKILYSKTPVEVTLNKEYNATITEEGVQVGCQTFTFDAVKKLCAAIEKFEKD